MIDGFDWFPCEPDALLGALAGMKAPEGYVYIVTLLRIYESGGACPDTLDALATRTRLNKRVVSEALDSLFKSGRLYRGEGGIRNKKADSVIASSIALREKRKSAGADAANRRWKKTEKNQQKVDSVPNADPMRFDAQLQLQQQDSLFSDEKRVPAKPKRALATEPSEPEPDPPEDGWPADHLEQFWQAFPPFRREGKRKVGEKLARLRRDKVVAWDVLIAAVRKFAATEPGQFACAPIVWLNGEKWDRTYGGENATNRNGNPAGQGGGFSTIAARLRQEIASRETVDLRTPPGPESPHRH